MIVLLLVVYPICCSPVSRCEGQHQREDHVFTQLTWCSASAAAAAAAGATSGINVHVRTVPGSCRQRRCPLWPPLLHLRRQRKLCTTTHQAISAASRQPINHPRINPSPQQFNRRSAHRAPQAHLRLNPPAHFNPSTDRATSSSTHINQLGPSAHQSTFTHQPIGPATHQTHINPSVHQLRSPEGPSAHYPIHP